MNLRSFRRYFFCGWPVGDRRSMRRLIARVVGKTSVSANCPAGARFYGVAHTLLRGLSLDASSDTCSRAVRVSDPTMWLSGPPITCSAWRAAISDGDTDTRSSFTVRPW
jgi:hypothetical protein